jgi:glycosyltransferase involved in cell wall biosynthesis
MKKYLILTTFIFCVIRPLLADPLIVAVLMVKNEEPVIVQTLEPLVNGGIDAFLIFDTGSTDATIQKAQEFLSGKGIKNFYIEQEPFVDFSVSRNRALDLAEQHFPHANFMLMPDAEWFLQNVEGLVSFCKEKRTAAEPGYLLRIINQLDYYNCRLIRCRTGIRFKCPVHEYVDYLADIRVPEDVFFSWNSTRYGCDKSAKRWLRDRDLLLKSYHENPSDPRTLFYLAQTYKCLGDQYKAHHFYLERTRMPGWHWNEETYMAYYYLAEITEQLAVSDSEHYSWSQALFYYLKAHATRSCRAEPLIRIARYYHEHKNFILACLFAKRACALPYPKEDSLFVEKDLYNYTRYDILGQCAWYIGDYHAGEQALREAMKQNPGNSHFVDNLLFYLDRSMALGRWGVQAVDIGLTHEQKAVHKVWSILICTITERKEQLEQLLADLKKQICDHGLQDAIEILIFSDNRGECPIGYKRNKLLQASKGDYICFVDDDDAVHPQYIKMIYDKLQNGADCVSLQGIRTVNGAHPQLFIHSIQYDAWFDKDNVFYRPPNHLNPIKREKALQFSFPIVNWGEDRDWSMAIARSGCLKTEEVITEPYYFYRFSEK